MATIKSRVVRVLHGCHHAKNLPRRLQTDAATDGCTKTAPAGDRGRQGRGGTACMGTESPDDEHPRRRRRARAPAVRPCRAGRVL